MNMNIEIRLLVRTIDESRSGYHYPVDVMLGKTAVYTYTPENRKPPKPLLWQR